MVVLILTWFIMAGVFFVIGTAILKICRADVLTDRLDRFFVSQWLGIIFTTNVLLAVSLFTSLSSFIALISLPLLMCVAICFSEVRNEVRQVLKELNISKLIVYLGVSIFVSAFISKDMVLFDAGWYHYKAIQWLAQYGSVKGVALTDFPLGYYKTWFTIPALFDIGYLNGKMFAVSNGFITVLMIHQFFYSAKMLMSQQLTDKMPKWFIVFFVPLIFYPPSEFGIVMSPSPDIPIMYLTGVFCWLLLLLRNESSLAGIKYVLLFLGIGAVTLKLNGIPLQLFGLLIFLRSGGKLLVNIFSCLILSFTLLLPAFLNSITTSGCPLFPSSIGCLNLPWGYNSDEVSMINQTQIKEANASHRWEELASIDIIVIFILVVICAVLGLLFIGFITNFYRDKVSFRYIISLSVVGLLFAIYFAPNPRFYLGYIVGLSALGLAVFSTHFSSKVNFNIANKFFYKYLKFLYIILLVIWVIAYQRTTGFYFLPAQIRVPESSLVQAVNPEDFEYRISKAEYGLCWAIEIPCARHSLDNIKLLNVQKGISGGFRKVR